MITTPMDHLMRLIFDHLESGAAGMTDVPTLARQTGQDAEETEAMVTACYEQGWVALHQSRGQGHTAIRGLTLMGRLHVEQGLRETGQHTPERPDPPQID